MARPELRRVDVPACVRMNAEMLADLRAAAAVADPTARRLAMVLAFSGLNEKGRVYCLTEKLPQLLNDEDLKNEIETLRIELGWD